MYKKIGLKPEDVLAKAKKGGLRGYENGGFDVIKTFFNYN